MAFTKQLIKRFSFLGGIGMGLGVVSALVSASPQLKVPDTLTDGGLLLVKVDKTRLEAELATLPQIPGLEESFARFPIAIGKESGDKLVRGDNKTPEGIYFTLETLSGIPKEKYGPKAIPLNFPNPIDQILGKTGYGIWLHGAGNDNRIQEKFTTEGCVAFYNADIEKLANWLKPHQTVVVIAKDLKQVNQPKDLSTVTALTQDWMQSWANRRLDKYISYYHPEFKDKSRNVKQYGNFKKAVFNSYKTMTVDFSNLRVITHPKYAVAIMNQDFNGDKRMKSIGRKVVYWQKEGDEWRISREVFEQKRVELFTRDWVQEEVLVSKESKESINPMKVNVSSPSSSSL